MNEVKVSPGVPSVISVVFMVPASGLLMELAEILMALPDLRSANISTPPLNEIVIFAFEVAAPVFLKTKEFIPPVPNSWSKLAIIVIFSPLMPP